MKELWVELSEMVSVARLTGLRAEHVINAFIANYLAGLVLMRMHDIESAALLRDKTGARLDRFTSTMSDPNFWGYAALFPRDKYVVAKLGQPEAERIYKLAGKITENGARKIMQLLQTPADMMNWDQAYYTLALLKDRFELSSTYLDRVAPILRTWEHRSNVERGRAVANAYQYLMQSDPRSRLMKRLGELQSTLIPTGGMGFQSFFRIYEDGEGAVAGGTSAASIGTNSGAMAGGPSANSIITPPGYSTATNSGNSVESPVGTKWSKDGKQRSKELLGNLYKSKLPRGKKSGAMMAKLKKFKRLDSKIIRKKRRDFLPRTFKDPELNSVLGDHSDVRVA